MAISFDRVKAGDVLYDVHSVRMGNTTMRRLGCWCVEVREIDTVNARALVSWNGNPEQWWHASRIRRLRRTPLKEKP